jgi:hypothetical protein
MLDVLWSVGSYERLVADWGLAPQDAIDAVTWVIGLVEHAIRDEQRPGGGADTEILARNECTQRTQRTR